MNIITLIVLLIVFVVILVLFVKSLETEITLKDYPITKLYKVIESCKTLEQYRTAYRYYELYSQRVRLCKENQEYVEEWFYDKHCSLTI